MISKHFFPLLSTFAQFTASATSIIIVGIWSRTNAYHINCSQTLNTIRQQPQSHYTINKDLVQSPISSLLHTHRLKSLPLGPSSPRGSSAWTTRTRWRWAHRWRATCPTQCGPGSWAGAAPRTRSDKTRPACHVAAWQTSPCSRAPAPWSDSRSPACKRTDTSSSTTRSPERPETQCPTVECPTCEIRIRASGAFKYCFVLTKRQL